ncbi:uncharacterized protein involved in response to NO [Methylohalomonas lacus]|uniref:Uncharacterized protein involved in response to NO n=1 Tax=Methylohalomonas lacus TaxID=398773 RepID=A0AAE3HIW9_9GAMM|nr:NnrS family protein [Methylohalomonas lacus]MCS3903216.1 uncharacterized protein involved in response to NO [Methylohalomonas lacus]
MARSKLPAQRLFFPAAALHAAVLIPLSMANLLAGWSWPAGLAAGHGREMLFGFVLALIAGYLLGPQPRPRLYGIFALWLAARIAALVAPASVVTGFLSPAFVLVTAWFVVPKLLAAKKWRNRSIAPLVLVLFLLPIGYQVLVDLQWFAPAPLLLFGIILLSLLMLFMGGRIIAAAAAGEVQRRGGRLTARVQPSLEAALIILLVLAAVLSVVPGWRMATGLVLLTAGLIAGLRLIRWRLWQCRRADLFALGAGYFWLAIGLLALGATLLLGNGYSGAMHVITIGALGTLSITIAARVHLINLQQAAAAGPFFYATAVLIALATLLRLLAVHLPGYTMTSLWLASGAWSLAYLLLLALLLGALTPGRGLKRRGEIAC